MGADCRQYLKHSLFQIISSDPILLYVTITVPARPRRECQPSISVHS